VVDPLWVARSVDQCAASRVVGGDLPEALPQFFVKAAVEPFEAVCT
jgi:hypothetical protein